LVEDHQNEPENLRGLLEEVTGTWNNDQNINFNELRRQIEIINVQVDQFIVEKKKAISELKEVI
jgi:hypothetical protein